MAKEYFNDKTLTRVLTYPNFTYIFSFAFFILREKNDYQIYVNNNTNNLI